MGYFVIKLFSNFASDWNRGFQIYEEFTQNMNDLISSSSFNRYFGGNILLSHISVRLNLTDDKRGKERGIEIAEQLKLHNSIIAYSNWNEFNVHDDVKKGCEIASIVSIAFRNWMITHQNVFNFFLNSQTKVLFMSRFLPILLIELGFNSNYEIYPIDQAMIENIRELASSCADSCRTEMPENPTIDFMERFIHHFMNCILVDTGREEQAIYNIMNHFNWLKSLII